MKNGTFWLVIVSNRFAIQLFKLTFTIPVDSVWFSAFGKSNVTNGRIFVKLEKDTFRGTGINRSLPTFPKDKLITLSSHIHIVMKQCFMVFLIRITTLSPLF